MTPSCSNATCAGRFWRTGGCVEDAVAAATASSMCTLAFWMRCRTRSAVVQVRYRCHVNRIHVMSSEAEQADLHPEKYIDALLETNACLGVKRLVSY